MIPPFCPTAQHTLKCLTRSLKLLGTQIGSKPCARRKRERGRHAHREAPRALFSNTIVIKMWLNIIGHYLIRQNSKRGISCPARHTLHSKGGPQSPTPNIKELPVAEVCRVFSSIASWVRVELQSILGGPEVTRGEVREGMWIRFLLSPYQSKARLLQRLSKLRILPLWGQKNTPTSHPNRCSLRSVPSWPLQQSISTAQKTPTRRTKRTSLTASAAEKQKNKQQLPLLPQTAYNSRVKRRLRQKLNKRLHRLSTKGSDLSYAVKRHCKTPGLLCKERLELKCQLSKKNK